MNRPLVAIESLTANLLTEIRSTLEALRALVVATVPTVTETLNLGWRSISFTHPRVGYFCGLFPFDDRIEVAFEFGILLDDPEGALHKGRGSKRVRYLRISPRDPIPNARLRRLLEQAVSLPANRAARVEFARTAGESSA